MTDTVPPHPRHRVPVEHRLLGLDRRTFPYAIGLVVVWLLWVVALPAIDGAVPWNDTTRAGEVFRVTDTATITPAAGWGVQEGLRTTDRTASGDTSADLVLVTAGAAFQVTSGPWTGTPAELVASGVLLDRAVLGDDFRPTSAGETVRTDDGDVGALTSFATPTVEGLIVAFVFDGTGVQIQATGTPAQLAAHAGDVDRMIASLSDEGDGS
ncbi:hypothetical protein [Pseudonocardia broussonetiae]|uniref:Uncharacterized protein n=1 Tax=Pseudonocardia broussonetiae TaxID=2736640 RepID=A0A6M6JSF3_9PSEU|nr:hypothetical protein [Pseudonocardia broussonetiae]QJY49349.1 hypothetical protein HOP40_29325 [Pseudonocardia broussonetiae]